MAGKILTGEMTDTNKREQTDLETPGRKVITRDRTQQG